MTDEYFVKTSQDINDPAEILNWYRNLYHAENENTERGIMARAINDILPEYIKQKEEIKRLRNAYKQCTWERNIFFEESNNVEY